MSATLFSLSPIYLNQSMKAFPLRDKRKDAHIIRFTADPQIKSKN